MGDQTIRSREPAARAMRAEIRCEIRKSMRAMSELLRALKSFPPTTVPVQSQTFARSFRQRAHTADLRGKGREVRTSFTDDPGYMPSVPIYSKLFMPPVVTNDMIRQPLGGQPDWRKMFQAWNVINVTVMIVCSAFYYILETLLDIANFSAEDVAIHFFERLLHLLAFLLFSHLTWYMAMRKSLINLLLPLGPHYYWIVAVVFLYFWLECIWVAQYEVFFLPLIVPTFYICLTCFRLFQIEKQAQLARDLQPVGLDDTERSIELSPNPWNSAAQPLST